MKFKSVDIILNNMNLDCIEFRDVEWNNSEFGVSISPKEGEYIFYPFHAILNVHAKVI